MDYKEIDNHLQSCIDKGYQAALDARSKFENPYDHGSLSFDAWNKGFELMTDYRVHLDGIGG